MLQCHGRKLRLHDKIYVCRVRYGQRDYVLRRPFDLYPRTDFRAASAARRIEQFLGFRNKDGAGAAIIQAVSEHAGKIFTVWRNGKPLDLRKAGERDDDRYIKSCVVCHSMIEFEDVALRFRLVRYRTFAEAVAHGKDLR